MVCSTLLGFIRKSNDGIALKLSIHRQSFEDAPKYTTKNGEVFVQMLVNLDSVQKIIDEEKEVASVSIVE